MEMGRTPPNGELLTLIEQLQATTDEAREVFGGLDERQINWKP